MPFTRVFCQQHSICLLGNARLPFLVLPKCYSRTCDSGLWSSRRWRPIRDRRGTLLLCWRVPPVAWSRSLRERSGARRGRSVRAFGRGVRLCAAEASCKNQIWRRCYSIRVAIRVETSEIIIFIRSFAVDRKRPVRCCLFWIFAILTVTKKSE